ncbi:hypothetical protein GCM10007424_05160 [Flavobacterium suaedae]|uniref:Secretion system C-terminal sorting domain-containing protein n=1 Tax=Flavobacterium suaedae TaxID=1767027 RepID=A0ABQ1JII8_9FLAO|nr:T9SS type A sorting domain-containing protein [Flavobacterium suaedae]GGB68127.1 hypothetical protein GCM10007424_05160 [Flavobacterium suaedae]
MKNFYLLFASLLSSLTFAQQSTSFESSEGYELGTIHGQNDWEVTEGSDGLITNQVITDEEASEGSFSFKNAFEPSFSDQWFPIFGASKTFDEPIDYTNLTVSYDVLVTETDGSDFEFTLFAINENEEYVPVAGVGIENRGYIYLIKDVDYGFDYAEAEWTPNEWINVRIEVSADEIKYYINDTLENTIANYTQLDIVGLNMLHNNFGADGYYDNFVITTGSLSTPSFENNSFAVFPNPTRNILSISLPDNKEVSEVEFYDILGQRSLITSQTQNINISALANGIYILQVNNTDGTIFTKKVVKQ